MLILYSNTLQRKLRSTHTARVKAQMELAVGSILVSRRKEVSTINHSPWQMSFSRKWDSVLVERVWSYKIEKLGLYVSTQFKNGI